MESEKRPSRQTARGAIWSGDYIAGGRTPGPLDGAALFNAPAAESPPLTFADLERAIVDLPPPSERVASLEVSPQMKAGLDARLETRPSGDPYAFVAPGLPVEVDPLLRFDPNVFRVVYADGHKEHRAPDDHPLWGKPKLVTGFGALDPGAFRVRFYSPPVVIPLPGYHHIGMGGASVVRPARHRRSKRASKGWRKHVRRMKAADRRNTTPSLRGAL